MKKLIFGERSISCRTCMFSEAIFSSNSTVAHKNYTNVVRFTIVYFFLNYLSVLTRLRFICRAAYPHRAIYMIGLTKLKLSELIIDQIFSLAPDLSKRITWLNIPQLKLGNTRGYSPIFKTVRVEKNICRIIYHEHYSLYLARKCFRILVLGHHVCSTKFRFPQAALSENCSLL